MTSYATATEPGIEALQRLLDAEQPRTRSIVQEVGDASAADAPPTLTFHATIATLATDAAATAIAAVMILQRVARGLCYEALRGSIATEAIACEAECTIDARSKLASETTKHALLLASRLAASWRPPTSPTQLIDETRQIHVWDAIFVDYLQGLGTSGAAIAAVLFEEAVQRARWLRSGDGRLAYKGHARSVAAIWQLWYAPSRPLQCAWVAALAKALWRDVVQPDLAREKDRLARNHEALAMPIHLEVVRLHSRAGHRAIDGSNQLSFDDGTTIRFGQPYLPGTELIDASAVALISRGIGLLGSVDAHRLLRWEVGLGYARAMARVPQPHVLDVERGYGELAELLGIRDNGAPQRLRALLLTQRSCAFPLPGPGNATGNLVILSERQGSGRRPTSIRIELGTVLMPQYIYELSNVLHGRDLNRAQHLVPLVAMPPFVGRDRDHGPQVTLSMLVTREMRLRADELYRNGAVRIELSRWAGLADEARIPRKQVRNNLQPILDRWTRDGSDGPAFLRREGKDDYTLGDAHDAARRFIQDAGKREHEGAEAGRRSVAAREAKRRRTGR